MIRYWPVEQGTDRFVPRREVAAAVVYLASPGAASVTGHTLVLDGDTTVC
jgi:NAD(P)-dependent dehydrogenase (short-subunit alcohol dehydrogenase family)